MKLLNLNLDLGLIHNQIESEILIYRLKVLFQHWKRDLNQ